MTSTTRASVPANTRLAPDPTRLAGLLVRVWLETRFGRRDVTQLAPLVSPALLLRLREPAPVRDGPLPTIRRITSSEPIDGVCEAVVTLTWPSQRVTAVAVRLEQRQGQWRAVELRPPEAGMRPPVGAMQPRCHRPPHRQARAPEPRVEGSLAVSRA